MFVFCLASQALKINRTKSWKLFLTSAIWWGVNTLLQALLTCWQVSVKCRYKLARQYITLSLGNTSQYLSLWEDYVCGIKQIFSEFATTLFKLNKISEYFRVWAARDNCCGKKWVYGGVERAGINNHINTRWTWQDVCGWWWWWLGVNKTHWI